MPAQSKVKAERRGGVRSWSSNFPIAEFWRLEIRFSVGAGRTIAPLRGFGLPSSSPCESTNATSRIPQWNSTMKSALHRAIRKSTGERSVHRELEKHPGVLKDLVVSCCNCCYVVSHFRLGDEYEADFVVLHGFSGGWDIHFIELEPPALAPFNRKGEFVSRLVHAAGQIRRWKEFANRPDKAPYLTAQLRDAVMSKDLLWRRNEEPTDHASLPITRPESMLLMHYHVVMGLRAQLTVDLMSRKAGLIKTDGFELITYDRVLDVYERRLRDSSCCEAE
jgi:hypothetical protein